VNTFLESSVCSLAPKSVGGSRVYSEPSPSRSHGDVYVQLPSLCSSASRINHKYMEYAFIGDPHTMKDSSNDGLRKYLTTERTSSLSCEYRYWWWESNVFLLKFSMCHTYELEFTLDLNGSHFSERLIIQVKSWQLCTFGWTESYPLEVCMEMGIPIPMGFPWKRE